MTDSNALKTSRGRPSPLGAHLLENGVNFSLYSTEDQVEIAFFEPKAITPTSVFPMTHSGDFWHIQVEGLSPSTLFAFKIKSQFVLCPYTKALATGTQWGVKEELILAKLPTLASFDWQGDEHPNLRFEDLIIYEMHLRGFTQDPSSGVKYPGTYLGMIEKLPYLKELGINAVELLPIFEFDETAHPAEGLFNYWGYSTLNFFSPMNRYATEDSATEFKALVKACHEHGIEVILDVVFNHVGDRGFLEKLAKSTYFILDASGHHTNYTGCGNTIQCNHSVVAQWILACLRYWAEEMHIDGFRFDLASVFFRGGKGEVLETSPLIEAIQDDPLLSKRKLIAEPWDSGGLYQLGGFPPQWGEWNGQFRDTVRRFLKGTDGQSGAFAAVLTGSTDRFSGKAGPHTSINFVTAHDGFTLRDLVSYNEKHNADNGEENRDGNDWNESWNCGEEGSTSNPEILHLRDRQMRNFLVALFLSFGTPMFHMGDEYGHTREGNNNSYCLDNRKNHFLWDALEKEVELASFLKDLILLRNSQFSKEGVMTWHGKEPNQPNWSPENRFLAYSLGNLYVAFNAQFDEAQITLPEAPKTKTWELRLDTNLLNFSKSGEKSCGKYTLHPHSTLIMLAE